MVAFCNFAKAPEKCENEKQQAESRKIITGFYYGTCFLSHRLKQKRKYGD
jgi:hypothetical protein